jgi:hypothetical protein
LSPAQAASQPERRWLFLGATGRAAKAGALVKGGRHMETLAHADPLVLDKTGTSTLGTPEGIAIEPVGVSWHELLQLAASADKYSEHTVARAILRQAAELHLETIDSQSFSAEPGRSNPSEPIDAAQHVRLFQQSAAHFQGAIGLTEPTEPSRHVFGFGAIENPDAHGLGSSALRRQSVQWIAPTDVQS